MHGGGCGPPCPASDDVIMVASELGANAIKFTVSGRGGWFAVEVTWWGSVGGWRLPTAAVRLNHT